MTIDYLATGLFFLWISFSIFKWVVRNVAAAADAPPAITPLEEEVLRAAAARSGRRISEKNF